MMLDDDPKFPNAISEMLPVILGDIGSQLRQSHEPAFHLGLVAFVHFTRIITGLTAPAVGPVKSDPVVQSDISIADTLYSSRPKEGHFDVPEGA